MCIGKISAKTDGVQVTEKWLLGRVFTSDFTEQNALEVYEISA